MVTTIYRVKNLGLTDIYAKMVGRYVKTDPAGIA